MQQLIRVACVAASLWCGTAYAQQSDSLIEALGDEWSALRISVPHTQEKLLTLINAYRGVKAQLDAERAYWKAWCGDRTGCAAVQQPEGEKK